MENQSHLEVVHQRLRYHASVLIHQHGPSGDDLKNGVYSAVTQLGLPLSAIPADVVSLVARMGAKAFVMPPAARRQVPPAAAARQHSQPVRCAPAAQPAIWTSQQDLLRAHLVRMQSTASASTIAATAAAAALAAAVSRSGLQPTSAEVIAQRLQAFQAANRTNAAAAPPSKKQCHESTATAADARGAGGKAVVLEEDDAVAEEGQEVGTDENEDGHTYAEYRAMQIRAMHPDIMGHPDALVETASLASVPLPPPSFRHSLHDCVAVRLLSDAQLETVVYANMKFSGRRLPDGKRAGFFLGDGAGVGKGRQIAGLIKQHWNDGGRRALWVSVSSDLLYDAARDLKDVKAGNIPICPRGSKSVPTGRGLERFGDGCLFITYSLLISGLGGKATKAAAEGDALEDALWGAPPVDQGRMRVPAGSRLAQIVAWLKGDNGKPPLLVFDECHKAKNLLPTGSAQPTQTARAVVEIQEQLPEAKILYSSATGASEPRNLAYMTRLGLFGFKDAQQMVELLSKSKLGALELAAMSLKATGTYLSRTLSYAGAEFALGYVEVEEVFKVMYDRATSLWTLLWKIVQCHPRISKLQGVFWFANQRFWKQMLMASKVPACAAMAKEAVANGMAVVVGLQSTGEANTKLLKKTSGNSFDDLVSAPRMVLEQYIRSQFPLDNGGASQSELDSLEFQVFNAIQAWRSMLPASEVVAQQAQGREVQHAAALMGLCVNKQERRSEDEIIAIRAKMKKAASKEEARRAEWQRKGKQELWAKWWAAQERRLRFAKEQAAKDVAAAQQVVARLEAKAAVPVAAQAAGAGLEDSSNDEEEGLQTLAQRATTGGKAGGSSVTAKRKAAVLEYSDEDDGNAGKENVQRHTGQRKPVIRRRVLGDSSFSSDKDDDLPLSMRPSLALGAAGAVGTQPPLAFRVLQEPVEIDLTLDDDLACMICGQEDDEENMLLCDGCNRGCHMLCASLRRMPVEPTWSCAGCSTSKRAGSGMAGAGAKQQHQRRRGRVRKEGVVAVVTLLDSDDDADIFAAPRMVPQVTGDKMQMLVAEQRLDAARRQLRTAEAELEAFAEQTAEGPPPTPPHPTLLGACQQQRGRPRSASFDPTVHNLQLSGGGVAGYRHAVKVHGLADIQLPEGLGQELPCKDAALLAVEGDEAQEAFECEEDEGELADMDEDLGVPEADVNADISPQLLRMRGWLLRIVAAMELPPNPLDQLIELLGGQEHVAELTGRKGYVCKEDGGEHAVYKQRGGDGSQKDINMREKEAFMSSRKLVAIISDAASTGISLQADRRVENQRRRCHITLELPWSADKAIQQFGRSHRANQVSAPLYRILTVPVGGEYRFASAAAKRLASLGALLRGDRNAIGAGSELKAFDIDNALGERALLRVMQDICGDNGSKPMPGIKVPELPREMALPEFLNTSGWDRIMEEAGREAVPAFFQYMRTKLLSIGVLEEGGGQCGSGPRVLVPTQKAKLKVPRFLNRLLGLPMIDQELLFQYFTDTLDATIAQLKSEGKFDSGIVTIKGRSCQVVGKRPMHCDASSGGEVQHVEISLDRGLPWEAALAFKTEVEDKLEEQEPGHTHVSGFYVQHGHDLMAGGKRRPHIMLATEIIKSASNIRNTRFHIQRPNLGSCPGKTLAELEESNFRQLGEADAKPLWEFWYQYTDNYCTHGDNCSQRRHGSDCHHGLRKATIHLICGAVLPIWQKLEKWHDRSMWGRRRQDGNKLPLRVVKTIQEDGSPLVGVEASCREELEYFEHCLAQPEAEPSAAPQRGRAQPPGGTSSSSAAAALAGVPGGAAGFGIYVPRQKKKHRRPKKGRGGFNFPFR